MKQLFIIWMFSCACLMSNAQAPDNDNCADATLISTTPFGATCSASVSASTLNATQSVPGPSCTTPPDDDTWYRFIASSSSIVFRYSNARNAATGKQTSPGFALYEGGCPTTTASFVCFAVNTAGTGLRIVDGLTPGTTYYLRLWSLTAGIVMEIDFCIQEVPAAPANDECAGAQVINPLPAGSACTSPIPASTVGATRSTPNASCAGTSSNDDIWYSFTANTSAARIVFNNARLATSNANANVGYALYEGTCPATTATFSCSGNLGSNSGSVTVGGLTAGETYYIRFFSLADNNYMTFDFCVIDVNVAANDECANAIPLNTFNLGDAYTPTRISTSGGTESPNEPGCAANENNDDVWYRFSATTPTIVLGLKNAIVNETGSNGTAGFALYHAACPTSSTTLACNTLGSAVGENIINGLVPGEEYYLRLWSTLTGGNTVSVDVYILNVPTAPNDECANAIPITLQEQDSDCSNPIHASTAGATRSSPDPSCATFNDDDTWYSFLATSNAVRINFSNVTKLAGTGSPALGVAVHQGDCASLPSALICSANEGTNGSVLVGGLIAGKTYLLQFFSYDVNNFIEFDFCVVNTGLPPNDECSDATVLLTGDGFCTTPVMGSLKNATTSPGFGAPACSAGGTSEDVWFRATVPASGNLVVQTSVLSNNAAEDLLMEAYYGDCRSLTFITCDDDGNPEPSPNELHPRISLTGRTPGETIYFRVVRKFPLAYGEFAICAWDPTVLVPIADGGSCVPAEPLTIDAAHANTHMWVPLLDGNNRIIAEINARGAELGVVDANLFVNTSGSVRNLNGHYYLDRNLSINPQNAGGARVRLYIKDAELQALQAVDANITGVGSLKINKTNAPCGPVFAGTASVILQNTSGSYGQDHFIEFTVPSFSGFFLDGGQSALPLEFVSFKATREDHAINLEWVVVQDETIDKFYIQRSDDGLSFKDIGEKTRNQFLSAANNNWQYIFRDEAVKKTVYYRVRMVDVNGKQVHSKVIAVNAVADYTGIISVYPNPVDAYCVVRMPANVTTASFTLYNGSGMVVKQLSQQVISNGVYTLDLRKEPSGVYFLQVRHKGGQFQFKVIKR